MAKKVLPWLVLLALVIHWTTAHDFASAQAQTAAVEPSTGELLSAQILANSYAQAVYTPEAGARDAWEQSPRWASGRYTRGNGTFVLVKIDDALLDAAVMHWASGFNAGDEDRRHAKDYLTRRFIRTGANTFVLFAPPLRGSYRTWWAFSLPDFPRSVVQRTFDGRHLQPVLLDSCEQHVIYSFSPAFTCIFGVRQIANQDHPYYYVTIYAEFMIGKQESHGQDHPHIWLRATRPQPVEFRIDLGPVPLMSMVRRGMPWDRIREVHLDPHAASIRVSQGDEVSRFMVDVGVQIVSALLLRSIRFR